MKARTRWGLETAERDYRLAEYLASTSSDILPDYRWATIAAFYAAVQFINALLFERLEFIPNNHEEREAALNRISQLNIARDAYSELKDAALAARYAPRFPIPEDRVRRFLDVLVPTIRTAVLANLEPDA